MEPETDGVVDQPEGGQGTRNHQNTCHEQSEDRVRAQEVQESACKHREPGIEIAARVENGEQDIARRESSRWNGAERAREDVGDIDGNKCRDIGHVDAGGSTIAEIVANRTEGDIRHAVQKRDLVVEGVDGDVGVVSSRSKIRDGTFDPTPEEKSRGDDVAVEIHDLVHEELHDCGVRLDVVDRRG